MRTQSHPLLRFGVVLVGVCLLLSACTATKPAPPSTQPKSGIRGTFTGTTTGGPFGRRTNHFVVAHQTVTAHMDGRRGPVVATTKSSSKGLFRLDLPPGTYVVVGELAAEAETVTVRAGAYSSVTLTTRTAFFDPQ